MLHEHIIATVACQVHERLALVVLKPRGLVRNGVYEKAKHVLDAPIWHLLMVLVSDTMQRRPPTRGAGEKCLRVDELHPCKMRHVIDVHCQIWLNLACDQMCHGLITNVSVL